MPENDNIVQLGVKPKAGSPAEKGLQDELDAKELEECRVSVLKFLEAHLDYLRERKLDGHGAFMIVYSQDGSYILNNVGQFPLATMCGLLDIAKADFIARHIMMNAMEKK